MGNDSELSIIVRAKNEASRVLQQVQKDASGVGSKIANGFKAATPASAALLAGVTAAGAATVAFGVSSLNAYGEAQEAAAQLEAVIKSTGGAAGLTSEELMKQATALQSVTKFSDEAVMATQSMLLTFTQIKGGVVKDATKTALDMAQALGMDGKQAAMQLGKALNDPLKGLTKLTRVGVTFTAEQEKQVAAMVKAGDTAGAQKVILAELQKEFGGSAEAAGKTFPGQLEILKNTFGDLQEGIGQMIVGALTPLASAFSGWLTKVQEAGGLMQYFKDVMSQNQGVIAVVAGAIMGGLVPALVAAAGGLAAFLAPLIPFIAIGAAIGLVLKVIADRLGGWGALMTAVGNIASTIFGGLVMVFNLLKPSLLALVNVVVTQLWPALQNLWKTVSPVLLPALKAIAIVIGVALIGAIYTAINVIKIIISVVSWLINVFSSLFNIVRTVVTGIVTAIRFLYNIIAPIFKAIFAVAKFQFQAIYLAIAIIVSAIMAVVRPIANFIGNIFRSAANAVRGAWNSISGFFGGIVGSIRSRLSGVYSAITAPFARAWDFVKGIPGRIVSSIGNVGQLLRNKLGDWDIPGPLGKVRDVIPGFATGVQNFGGGLAYVHKGEVLANLPPGTDVYTAGQARKMMGGGGGVTNNFYGNITLDSDAAVDRFFERLNRASELADMGVPT